MKVSTAVLSFGLLLLNANLLKAQENQWQNIGQYISRDSVKHKSFTLVFINKDSTFAKSGNLIKQKMEDTFFQVYPELAKTFNKKALRKVTFIVDPAYNGVAATSNGIVRYNPKWMLKTPTDIDVVTHEVMHIVQDYGNTGGPGWLTEGIADYVRFKFGVDNATANWRLPDYKPGQSYRNSYRITARFLAWAEQKVKPNLVKELDKRLREHAFAENTWQQLTGKTLDELWAAYTANPEVTLS